MTSALAHAVGPQGSVTAFEPHPELFEMLVQNCKIIREETGATVENYKCAVTDEVGPKTLYCPGIWSDNRGTATLEGGEAEGVGVKVRGVQLDEIVDRDVQLIKIDVEGHEREVLEGGEQGLHSQIYRHIVFEEYAPSRSEVVEMLVSHEYKVFRLGVSLCGPQLWRMGSNDKRSRRVGYNCVATASPRELAESFAAKGWVSLQ